MPIDRYIGEAIGVFGRLRMSGNADKMFSNNIDFEGLFKLMGKLDGQKIQRGRKIFADQVAGPVDHPTCGSCHHDLTDRTEVQYGRTFIPVTKIDTKVVKTDPVFIQSLLGRTAQPGAMAAAIIDKDAEGNSALLKDVDRAAAVLKLATATTVQSRAKSLKQTY